VLNLSYGFTASDGSNNGNLVSLTSSATQVFMRSYTYDELNRLSTMSSPADPSGCNGLTWTYDAWANRTNQTTSSGACTESHPTIGANNQFTGAPYTYDAAGNMTADGNHTYTYDAENRLTTVDGGATATYVYDAEGQRVLKTTGGVTTAYLYDPAGNVVAETNGGDTLNIGYAYAGSQLVAEYKNSTAYFIHKDHLGSTRVMTAMDDSVYDSMDYMPYGEQIAGDTGTTHKFTGKERDAESGLDNFGARYNSSNLGRFMSPDPLLNSGHPANPQTWNRYTYTLNNPLNFLDPTGLYTLQNTCDAGDKKCNKNFEKNAKDLKNGLAALQKKVDGMKDSAQKARLEASLKSLGTDKDTSNGVNVRFGATGTGAAGNTVPVYDSAADKVTGYNVTLDPSKMGHSDATGEQDMAIDAAHEGTHVSDLATEYANPNAQPELSLFSLEYRGYQTSAWAAGALGLPNLSVNGNVIWNGSWATADKQITSVVVGLDKPGTPNPPHAETQPHNPWQN
jgi:RHS repeat-associated protein